MRLIRLLPILLVGSSLASCSSPSRQPALSDTDQRRVVLVTIDGVRWQEVFGGMDSEILSSDDDLRERLVSRFGGDTPQRRRRRLMPFLWQTVAAEGQIFGDPDRGAALAVTNGLNFSYPGYNELLTGRGDPRIDSNDKIPNPNVTILERLSARKGFEDRIAAVASWDVFPFILNAERSGLPVNAGWMPLDRPSDPELEMFDRLQSDMTREWQSVRFDAFTFHAALEELERTRPRLLFVGLGEPDDWAHEGRYDRYLITIQRADDFVARLWQRLQSDPEYAGRTSLVITTDHGRGAGLGDWTDHGVDVPGSERAWAAVLGPDTPPLGVRSGVESELSQIAATVALLLDEDLTPSAEPVAPPLPGVVGGAEVP